MNRRRARRAPRRRGNSKPFSRVRNRNRGYVFTWNNPPEDVFEVLKEALETTGPKCNYIAGREVGSAGTPHIQGYIRFEHQVAWKSVTQMLPLCHIEKAKGTTEQNLKYCSKDGSYVSTFPPSKKDRILAQYPPSLGAWLPWQKHVIDYVEGTPKPREIMWLWEPVGKTGKTWLARYLLVRYQAILGDGQRKDVFHQVVSWMEEHEKDPTVVILDIPRTRMQYFQYATLEALKDGIGHSGKYESCVFVFENCPHVIVFSNEPPEESKLSADRWNIVSIADYQ